MTSRRSPQGWWTRRAEQRQALQLVPPAPRMIGPMPLYPLHKPNLNVLPTSVKHSDPALKRMGKFTGVERRLLDKNTHVLEKSSGEYGYVQKLVKRGYFKALVGTGYVVQFVITPAGEKARAGMALLKSIQGKQGVASGKQFGHAAATG